MADDVLHPVVSIGHDTSGCMYVYICTDYGLHMYVCNEDDLMSGALVATVSRKGKDHPALAFAAQTTGQDGIHHERVTWFWTTTHPCTSDCKKLIALRGSFGYRAVHCLVIDDIFPVDLFVAVHA